MNYNNDSKLESYGESILEKEDESKIQGFENKEIPNIEQMREDLRSANNEIAKLEASQIDESLVSDELDSKFDAVERDVTAKELRGKTLPFQADDWIKNMFDYEPNEEDNIRIAKYLDDLGNKFIFDDFDVAAAETALGSNIIDSIKAVCETNTVEYLETLKRVLERIHTYYFSVTDNVDDMKELVSIARRVKKSLKDLKGIGNLDPDKPDFDIVDEKTSKLEEAKVWIDQYVEKKKIIDERNKKLRQDYRISDYDTKAIKEISECLEDAINMISIDNYVETSNGRLRKEYKDQLHNRTIEDWIDDIRNDPYIIYTLPTNDYTTKKEARINVENYIYSALLAHRHPDSPVPEDFDGDIGEYYVENNISDDFEVKSVKTMSNMILFIFAKTFKYKKLLKDRNRRILSYSLDMLSRLSSEPSYREKFNILGDYLFTQVL